MQVFIYTFDLLLAKSI